MKRKIEMTINIPKDYMRKVYFAEKTLRGWEVLSGYLLAEYEMHLGTKFIVTLGDMNSCVVRHLDTYSLDRKGAWASIADKEEKESKKCVQ